jgi:hypothetical protein
MAFSNNGGPALRASSKRGRTAQREQNKPGPRQIKHPYYNTREIAMAMIATATANNVQDREI